MTCWIQRLHAFFASWPKREACLKASGVGWSAEAVPECGHVQPFDCASGVIGALALAEAPRRVHFFEA